MKGYALGLLLSIRFGCICSLLMLVNGFSFGQVVDSPISDDLNQVMDRADIQGMNDSIVYSFLKPYNRQLVYHVLSQHLISDQIAPKAEQQLRLFQAMNADRPPDTTKSRRFWQQFWNPQPDFFSYVSSGFRLHLNPVLAIQVGLEQYPSGEADQQRTLMRFTRGLQLRVGIGKKFGVFSQVTENQAVFPQPIIDRERQFGSLWGEGFFKPYRRQGFDYFNAQAYITYQPINAVRIKLGRMNAFWGNGYRSLFLSDFAVEHYGLQIHARFWKLEYTNHIAQFIDFIPNKPDAFGVQPRKYGVFHQLSFYPTNKLAISLLESVIYSPLLPNGNRGFELQYLNPLIFYRAVEQYIGSPDNGFMGINLKWNFLRRFQLYGMGVLDDFNFGKRREGKGWWANKYGYQVGMKYVDVLGIPTLDLQLEYNRIRPYTYAHYNVSANYAHYGQMLAHDLGANVWDANVILRWLPFKRTSVMAIYTLYQQGADPAMPTALNYGANIFRTNVTHNNGLINPLFGNEVGQGISQSNRLAQMRISYQLFQSYCFVDVEAHLRTNNATNRFHYWGTVQFRYGFSNRTMRF
jgi:hypothetical protein